MKQIFILLLFIVPLFAWKYFMFVQFWPGAWIANDNIVNYDFSGTHWNVHGLWPENDNGSYPQFCNNSTIFNISVVKILHNQLIKYWNNYNFPLFFWIHEYMKHGTCLASDAMFKTEMDFFKNGLTLRDKFDIYSYLKNAGIVPNNNVCYLLQSIFDTIKNHIHVVPAIICEPHGILNQIIICLNPKIGLIDCPSYLNDCARIDVTYNKVKQNNYTNK